MKSKFYTYTNRSSNSLRKSVIAISGLASVLILGSANALLGAPLYWDISNGTGLDAGNGTWSTISGDWNTSASPASQGRDGWANPSEAFFNASGTSLVTVSGTVQVNSIAFNGTGYTIAGTTLTLTGVGGNITVNADAAISAVLGGTVGLTKLGAATLTLSGANTYTGLTDVQVGTLALGASNTFADSSTLKVSGGTLSLVTNSDTVAAVQLTGGSITSSSGVLTSTSAYDLQAGSVSAKLGGTGIALNKTTSGTVTLSGANTYTGITSITAGTLVVNGNQSSATGVVNVASIAKLFGTGTIGGETTILGTQSSGASSGAIGTQTFSSSLTYGSGSIFEWDINVTGGTQTHDRIVANSLLGSGAAFKIVDTGDGYAAAFWNSTRNWTATDLFGASNATVNLATIFTTTTSFNPSSLEGSFSFTSTGGGTSNQLTWTAVPEPTSALAGILLGAGLLRRKRTLRQSA